MLQQFHFGVYIPKRIKSRDSKRYLYTYVHSSIIHNTQKVEATQVSISGWMDKQNVLYMCNWIPSALKKKEIPTHARIWVKLEDILLSEIRESQRQTLNDFTYMRYLE